MKTLMFNLMTMVFFIPFIIAQPSDLAGAYANATRTITLRLKPAANGYHGVFQNYQGSYAITATNEGQQVTGKVYTPNGKIDFAGTASNTTTTTLTLSAWGQTETYYKYSDDHQLAQVDLTQYLQEASTAPSNSGNTSSAYPQIYNMIAGGQLVYYTRTSYLNDSNASSLTYVNFCSNGRFHVNYDGSFMVEGNLGGNAQGASYGNYTGSWEVVSQQGVPAIRMVYGNGNVNVTPVNMTLLNTGRLRVGNTQYAFQRNKVVCR